MKFYIRKLGCPKNDVDADYIAARLVADGHEAVLSADEAEAVIVNTCGFIQPAKEESIEDILTLAQLKETGKARLLLATGCLSQKYGEELLEGIEELDSVFGHGALDELAMTLKSSDRARKFVRTDTRQLAYLDWKDRFLYDSLPFSYMKISDGCNRQCTFCAIPDMRGRYRSRSLDSIVNEAQFLAANGKKELILVSQESTLWGGDLPGSPDLVQLLDRLGDIDGIEWLRLMYLYPGQVDDRLIEYLADPSNKTLAYYDLPLQHINSEILTAMKRGVDRAETEALVRKIRRAAPQGTLRTAFIVGFPGETEAQFQELYDWVAEVEFDRLGTFAFSAEDGTGAEQLPDQIPEEVKAERVDRLMMLQMEIAQAKNNSLIGNVLDVIIDTVDPEADAVGRTRGDCPEVDQEVYVRGDGIQVGDILRARVDEVREYDLMATKVTES
ncbi:MAG: 30S ribosomal protein S12 methylthiotransferase RimO [candidate division Zixibacteria bacterium]|nr:30S ribosomal protein S12 methylthiotransferase RimO [candidate division Zixibacteria bacterium]